MVEINYEKIIQKFLDFNFSLRKSTIKIFLGILNVNLYKWK